MLSKIQKMTLITMDCLQCMQSNLTAGAYMLPQSAGVMTSVLVPVWCKVSTSWPWPVSFQCVIIPDMCAFGVSMSLTLCFQCVNVPDMYAFSGSMARRLCGTRVGIFHLRWRCGPFSSSMARTTSPWQLTTPWHQRRFHQGASSTRTMQRSEWW